MRSKRIICFVGAGGKTTVMYALAKAWTSKGVRVLVTTTTHIWEPAENYAANLNEACKLWQQGKYAVVGQKEQGTGKLIALQEEELDKYIEFAEVVLVEADGAKGLPCKVPRQGEPVILANCDTVVGLFGMDALDQPMQKICFRIDQACALLGVEPEHILQLEDAANLLCHEQGTRKQVGERDFYLVLNKCESEEQGEKLKNLLMKRGIPKERIIIYEKR